MNDILISRGYLKDGEMTLTDWMTRLDDTELRLNNDSLVCIMNNAVSYYLEEISERRRNDTDRLDDKVG